MNTRRATPQDEQWIRSLIPRLHEFGPPGYRPVEAMNESESSATALAIAGGDDRVVIVAEADAIRLGFVHIETATDFFTHERHGHVSTLVVSPDAEGRGVGGALLTAAEEWCRTRGYRFITLHVFERNSSARRLYERSGFQVDTIKYLKLL